MSGALWRVIAASVAGASHVDGINQDAIGVLVDEDAVLLVVSDGLGSACHAATGSSMAVAAVLDAYRQSLVPHSKIVDGELIDMAKYARAMLFQHAVESDAGISPADLACTLLIAVADSEGTRVLQIGDGMLIGDKDGSDYQRLLVAIDHGATNLTSSLTGYDFPESIQVRALGPVRRLAVLSDGLDLHAFDFEEGRPYAEFFDRLFSRLDAPEFDQELLQAKLADYLRCEPVSALSRDDKSIILALRRDATAAAIDSSDATVS